ncbi:hypothetical protein QYF36_015440 [Acer negundo]|nr:hypothetical protein QYF36_015440 [Acer negundo]
MQPLVILIRLIGFGIIIRDKLGLVKAIASLNLKTMLSPLIAEALAVWRCIILAIENGLVPFHIETDSLHVADLVNKGLIWSTKGNLIAHNLAKLALSLVKDSCWLDACSPYVERLVQMDAFG